MQRQKSQDFKERPDSLKKFSSFDDVDHSNPGIDLEKLDPKDAAHFSPNPSGFKSVSSEVHLETIHPQELETDPTFLNTPSHYDDIKKYGSLILLIIQTCSAAWLGSYSTQVQAADGHKYLTTSAVVMTELFKFLFCSLMCWFQFQCEPSSSSSKAPFLLRISEALFSLEGFQCSIPSFLYSIQGNLIYLAVSHLNVFVYQLTYQSKLLSTALFSVIMLNRSLSRKQWLALFLLSSGVSCVSFSAAINKSSPKIVAKLDFLSGKSENPSQKYLFLASEEEIDAINSPISQILEPLLSTSTLVGLSAVMWCCISSGFAGVYFEKILKGSKTSIWVRNVQLSFFGGFFALFICFWNDFSQIREFGFFQGYTIWTWSIISVQALGGILVALVVKYSDNIMKGFATSLSLVLTGLVSVLIVGSPIDQLLTSGAGLVCFSVVLYNYP